MAQRGIGATFQRETRYSRRKDGDARSDAVPAPVGHNGHQSALTVDLPQPHAEGGAGLWDTLNRRSSVRGYDGRPVTLEDLSQLLWAATGATRRRGELLFRTAPSAGARYPIETYVAVHDVQGIAAGTYHYEIGAHALTQIVSGDCRLAVSAAALDQGMAADANLVLIWSAVFGRTTARYAERGYRYVYLDAGHVAQNAALAAVALGLGSCQIAALYDDEANALLGLDGETESVIYMTAVGRESRASHEDD